MKAIKLISTRKIHFNQLATNSALAIRISLRLRPEVVALSVVGTFGQCKNKMRTRIVQLTLTIHLVLILRLLRPPEHDKSILGGLIVSSSFSRES
jgi:hypothetical protein